MGRGKIEKFDEKGNVNYEELKKISEGIERGDIAITRLDETEERGRRAGGRRNVEASDNLGASKKKVEEMRREAGLPEQQRRKTAIEQRKSNEAFNKFDILKKQK